MSTLAFSVVGMRSEPYAASPLLALRLRVEESSGARIHAIALRVQIQIEPQRRRYEPVETERLTDLFGDPSRYGQTLRSLLWTHVSAMVLAFEGTTEFDLLVPCSYDFEVAANKYLAGLEDGEIPLVLFFSGTVLAHGEQGVEAELVSWECEARCRLPVQVWRETMDAYFPGTAWLRLSKDAFAELARYKSANGLPTWDAAITKLCAAAAVEK